MASILKPSAPLTPIEVQNFSREEDRKRLTSVALKAFRRLAEHWELSNAESASLLGVSVTTWERIKRGAWDGDLTQDQLTRVSALVGIFKGLRLLFADDMETRWLRLKNSGPLFNRAAPVDAMVEGGIPLMLEVRRYVDATRGGL
ncbi:MAG: DUF2384 domain-containing protein [Alphaproteobacteria bacterium]|nr:DUF2384 domain-containing protein [Alphaproteobacteria bacterium]